MSGLCWGKFVLNFFFLFNCFFIGFQEKGSEKNIVKLVQGYNPLHEARYMQHIKRQHYKPRLYRLYAFSIIQFVIKEPDIKIVSPDNNIAQYKGTTDMITEPK